MELVLRQLQKATAIAGAGFLRNAPVEMSRNTILFFRRPAKFHLLGASLRQPSQPRGETLGVLGAALLLNDQIAA